MTSSRIVQKFGGTSVASLERLRRVAERVAAEVHAGNQVAVVVSAMAGVTNQLIAWINEAARLPSGEEYDAVASSGEHVTAGLLALMLHDLGIPARSWHGWQLPIITEHAHRHARIIRIETSKISERLTQGEVAVVAGFQGITPDQRITTLGRGGSDTTAVALAVALEAERCDIYTDVDGVYTADPRTVPNAQKMVSVTYDEMFEMASLGAKVLQARSVEQAYQSDLVIRVLSSFEERPGTMIVRSSPSSQPGVHAVAADTTDQIMIRLTASEGTPWVDVLERLADQGIGLDMFQQSPHDPRPAASWIVAAADWRSAEFILQQLQRAGSLRYETVPNLRRISLVGLGLRGDPSILSRLMRSLSTASIECRALTSTEARISVLVESNDADTCTRLLHKIFIEQPTETQP